MEVTPPYLPSLEWIRCPDAFASMPARQYSRSLIESNSPGGMVLTVPVVGGASAAKRLKPWQLEISGHGDWTRIHLGALDAAYGREPYFGHFFPLIAPLVGHYPPMLADLNKALIDTVLNSVGYSESREEMLRFRGRSPLRFESIRDRLMSKINPRHSLVEPLFRLGPDILFLLTT